MNLKEATKEDAEVTLTVTPHEGYELASLTGTDRWRGAYRAVFLCAIVWSSTADVAVVWQLTDLFNGLMALPNLCALLLLSPQAFALLKQ